MRRFNDADLAKTGGRELRPSTRRERRAAKRLEKIALKRRKEQHLAYHLQDTDYAEISGSDTTGHNAMTPPKGDKASRRELGNYKKNTRRHRRANARIRRYDRQFKRISGIDPSKV